MVEISSFSKEKKVHMVHSFFNKDFKTIILSKADINVGGGTAGEFKENRS